MSPEMVLDYNPKHVPQTGVLQDAPQAGDSGVVKTFIGLTETVINNSVNAWLLHRVKHSPSRRTLWHCSDYRSSSRQQRSRWRDSLRVHSLYEGVTDKGEGWTCVHADNLNFRGHRGCQKWSSINIPLCVHVAAVKSSVSIKPGCGFDLRHRNAFPSAHLSRVLTIGRVFIEDDIKKTTSSSNKPLHQLQENTAAASVSHSSLWPWRGARGAGGSERVLGHEYRQAYDGAAPEVDDVVDRDHLQVQHHLLGPLDRPRQDERGAHVAGLLRDKEDRGETEGEECEEWRAGSGEERQLRAAEATPWPGASARGFQTRAQKPRRRRSDQFV